MEIESDWNRWKKRIIGKGKKNKYLEGKWTDMPLRDDGGRVLPNIEGSQTGIEFRLPLLHEIYTKLSDLCFKDV